MGKTRKQAEKYARNIQVITGRKMVVFRLPAGSDSLAARAGLRFGTCFADERETLRARRGDLRDGGEIDNAGRET